MIIGSGRSSSVQASLDVKGQVRAPQYIIGNPVSGSSITYGAVTANNLLPPPMFQGGTGLLTAAYSYSATNTYCVVFDPTERFAYSIDNTNCTIQAFTVDPTTGSLTTVGTAITTGSATAPNAIAIEPTGRFLYVLNSGSTSLYPFSINQSTGALTVLTLVTLGGNGRGVAADPTGRFVFVKNSNDFVQAYAINQTTGNLTTVGTAQSTATTSIGATAITVDPTGRFLYVGCSSFISMYSINQSTGALTAFATRDIAATSLSGDMAVDPTGRFLYFSLFSGTTINWYTIDQITGVLSGGSNVAGGAQMNGVAVDPTGRFVYGCGFNQNQIAACVIDQKTGALSAPVQFGSVPGPRSIAVSPTGRFLLAAATNAVRVFRINNFAANSGTFQDQLTIGTGNIVSTSAPSAVYVSGQLRANQYIKGNPISGSSITYNPVTSTNIIAPSSFLEGPARKLILSYSTGVLATNTSYGAYPSFDGQFLYLQNGNSIETHKIDRITGSWSYLSAVTAAQTALSSLRIHPSGKFLYGVNYSASCIELYTINQSTGALTFVSTTSLDSGGTQCVIDPSGKFLFAIARTAQLIRSYRINQSDGSLTINSASISVGVNTEALTVHPFLPYIYWTDVSGGNLGCVSFDSGTGSLTSVSSISTGQAPYGCVVDPTGKFLFVANYATASGVLTYTINQSTGVPTLAYNNTTPTTGAGCGAIDVDSTGRFVATTNATDGTVSLWIVNQYNGSLTFANSLRVSQSYAQSPTIKFHPLGTFIYAAGSNYMSAVVCIRYDNFSANSGMFTDSLVIGSERALSPQAILDVGGQVRSSQYVIGNPIENSSISYSALTSNNLLPLPSFQESSGLLTSVGAIASGSNPEGIAIHPSGQFAFVANYNGNSVQSYTINQSTGALTSVGSVSTGVSTNPIGVVVESTGRFLYVSCTTSYDIKIYLINQQTGALTSTGATTSWVAPNKIATDKQGKFIAIGGSSQYSGLYNIDKKTGSLVTGSSGLNLSTVVFGTAITPDGSWMFAGNGTIYINCYQIGANGSILVKLSLSTVTANGSNLNVDPTGRFLYVLSSSGAIQVFSINTILSGYNGSATPPITLVGSTSTQSSPWSLAFDPTGRFVYVANSGSNTIQIFSINQLSGLLTLVSSIATGSNPHYIAIDPLGKFLYVTNYGSDTVQAYRINNFAANSGTFQDGLTIATTALVPSASAVSLTLPSSSGTLALTSQITAPSTLLSSANTWAASNTFTGTLTGNKITQPNLPFVVNDISRYFDGNKASFPLRKDQSALTSLVTSSGTITSIVSNAAQFVVTHSLGTIVPGSSITISGCSTAGYNNTWLVNSSTSTTCTVVTPVNLASVPSTPGTLAGSLTSIVDSKDVEVILNGQYLDPYVTELRYPWISEWDANGGFKVSGSNLILYNAPVSGDKATVKVTGISQSVQTRRYPFSSATIALGE